MVRVRVRIGVRRRLARVRVSLTFLAPAALVRVERLGLRG